MKRNYAIRKAKYLGEYWYVCPCGCRNKTYDRGAFMCRDCGEIVQPEDAIKHGSDAFRHIKEAKE